MTAELAETSKVNILTLASQQKELWLAAINKLILDDTYHDRTDKLNKLKQDIETQATPTVIKAAATDAIRESHSESGSDEEKVAKRNAEIVKQVRELAQVRVMQQLDKWKEINGPEIPSAGDITGMLQRETEKICTDGGLEQIDANLIDNIMGYGRDAHSPEAAENQIDVYKAASGILVRRFAQGAKIHTTYGEYHHKETITNMPPPMTDGEKNIFISMATRYIWQKIYLLNERIDEGDLSGPERLAKLLQVDSSGLQNDLGFELDAIPSFMFYGYSGSAFDYSGRAVDWAQRNKAEPDSLAEQRQDSYQFGKAIRTLGSNDRIGFAIAKNLLNAPSQRLLRKLLKETITQIERKSSEEYNRLVQFGVDGYGAKFAEEIFDLKQTPGQSEEVNPDRQKIAVFTDESAQFKETLLDSIIATLDVSIENAPSATSPPDIYRRYFENSSNISNRDIGKRLVFNAIAKEISLDLIRQNSGSIPDMVKIQAAITDALARLDLVMIYRERNPEVVGIDSLPTNIAQSMLKIAFLRDLPSLYEEHEINTSSINAYVAKAKEIGIAPADMFNIITSYQSATFDMDMALRTRKQHYPDMKTLGLANDFGLSITNKYLGGNGREPKSGSYNWSETPEFVASKGDKKINPIGLEQSIAQIKELNALLHLIQERYDELTYLSSMKKTPTALINTILSITETRNYGNGNNSVDLAKRLDARPTETAAPTHLYTSLTEGHREHPFLPSRDPRSRDRLTPQGAIANQKSGGILGINAKPTNEAQIAESRLIGALYEIANYIRMLEGKDVVKDPAKELGIDTTYLKTYDKVEELRQMITKAEQKYDTAREDAMVGLIDERTKSIKSPEEVTNTLLAQMVGGTDSRADMIEDLLQREPLESRSLFGSKTQIKDFTALSNSLKSTGDISKALSVCVRAAKTYAASLKLDMGNILKDFSPVPDAPRIKKALDDYAARVKMLETVPESIITKYKEALDSAVAKRDPKKQELFEQEIAQLKLPDALKSPLVKQY